MLISRWSACVALLAVAVSVDVASAKVLDSVCNDVRALSQKEGTQWFGINSGGKLTPLKPAGAYSQDAIAKIIFLHSRTDQSASRTIVAAKLIYQTQDNYLDQDWVRAQNNYKRKPVSVKYLEYNSVNEGTSENFSLVANFHLPAGRDIPFATYSEDRRRQLVFPKNPTSEERSYRAYLLNFDAIAPKGSCVDFSPDFPSAIKGTTVEVIDLLPSDADRYYRFTIRFSVSP